MRYTTTSPLFSTLYVITLGLCARAEVSAKDALPQVDSDRIQIEGSVRSGDLYLPGATVIIRNGTQPDQTLTTDSAGRFRARVLAMPSYEIRVCKEGYLPAVTSSTSS